MTHPVRIRWLALVAALSCAALFAPAARANIYTQVLRAYETNGSVPPCQFSSQQLNSALKAIDTYGAQYFADFSNAVQNALAARAAGVCSPARRTVSATGARPAPLKLGPLTAATGASLPLPLLIMAGFAALLGLAGAVAAVWWWRGWDPPLAR